MRRNTVTVILALAAAGSLVSSPGLARGQPSPQEELAKLLEGRVAGEAQDCIILRTIDRLKVVDGAALVFRSGKTLWVNTTTTPDAIEKWDEFEFSAFGQRLCSHDAVSGRQGPLDLVTFVPYRKPESGE